MAWRRPGDKSLSEPMMVRLPTHIRVARPQLVKGPVMRYVDVFLMISLNKLLNNNWVAADFRHIGAHVTPLTLDTCGPFY